MTWIGGTAPTLTTTASAVDILVFQTLNGGGTWYGALIRPATGSATTDGSGIGGPTIAGLGLAMASISPVYANANFNLTNEQVDIILATATVSATITKIGFLCSVAGVTPGAGVNQMACSPRQGRWSR